MTALRIFLDMFAFILVSCYNEVRSRDFVSTYCRFRWFLVDVVLVLVLYYRV